MHSSEHSLTLWYGTDDAPAPPEGEMQGRRGVSLTVAVQPPHPSNIVVVRYSIDGGRVQTVRGVRLRTDFVKNVEYHRISFPDFWTGDTITYTPVVTCAGRIAPDVGAGTLVSSFRLARDPLSPTSGSLGSRSLGQRPTEWVPSDDRFAFSLEYLATIRIPLREPETIGVTPEGIKLNWFWAPAEGVVVGPKLHAKVRQIGGDWMTVRRDGVGVMDVRATLETRDGALLYVDYLGYYELGPNGYQDSLDRRWPVRAPTRTTPRFHTAHPSYTWLNRVQCVGMGEVSMEGEMAYTYDLYVLR